MSIDAAILRRLAALKLPGDAFQEVMNILAELQGADDARRERERVRRAKYPRRSQPGPSDKDGTVTGPSQGPSQDGPPSYSLKKENKIPEPSGSGATQAELERDLFRRGRQVCGKSSGGLINTLLKAKEFDVSLARSVLELAATKDDPRKFVAAATRSKGNGARSPTMAAADGLIARAKELEFEAGFGEPADETFDRP